MEKTQYFHSHFAGRNWQSLVQMSSSNVGFSILTLRPSTVVPSLGTNKRAKTLWNIFYRHRFSSSLLNPIQSCVLSLIKSQTFTTVSIKVRVGWSFPPVLWFFLGLRIPHFLFCRAPHIVSPHILYVVIFVIVDSLCKWRIVAVFCVWCSTPQKQQQLHHYHHTRATSCPHALVLSFSSGRSRAATFSRVGPLLLPLLLLLPQFLADSTMQQAAW